jgi:hypothetical protein
MFEYLTEKLRKKLDGWAGNSSSIGGVLSYPIISE